MFMGALFALGSSVQAAPTWTPIYIGSTVNGNVAPYGYYIFLPAAYYSNPSQKLPIMFFWHGAGEGGDGTSASSGLPRILHIAIPANIQASGPSYSNVFDTNNCIVVCGQNAGTDSWWGEPNIRIMMNHIFATYGSQIDMRRVYMTGLSAGSGAVTLFMNQDTIPQQMTAGYACAWRGAVFTQPAICKGIPFWGITNIDDMVMQLSQDSDILVSGITGRALNTIPDAAGNLPGPNYTGSYSNATNTWSWTAGIDGTSGINPKITILSDSPTGGAHDSWDVVYSSSAIYTWVFAQQKPDVTLTTPSSDIIVAQGSSVSFAGSATDKNGSSLTGSSLQWVSNISGVIGTGTSFSTSSLPPGDHIVQLVATDGSYCANYAQVHVSVKGTSALTAKFNFEPANTATPGGNWNTITSWVSKGTLLLPAPNSLTDDIDNAKDFSTGAATGVRCEVTGSFVFGQNYGTPSTALYPSPVQTYGFAATSATAGVTLSGLNPSQTYTVKVFGSSNGGWGLGAFTIGTTTQYYAQANNTSALLTFSSVVPDASGKIVLGINNNGGMASIAELAVIEISTTGGGGGGNSAPSITNSPTSTATAGSSYSFTYTYTGSPTPTFSITSGALPPGLALSGGGVISGTPTSTDSGPYSAIASATNGVGSPATSSFTISVNHSPAITNTAIATATVGSAYNFTYSSTGYPTPTFGVTSGSLPAGLSLSTAGVISGVPTAAGTSTGVVSAGNGIGSLATSNFTIVVSGGTLAPTISGAAPNGTVGGVYSYSYSVAGSPTPTCTVTSGSLPAGLNLSAGGTISGVPTTAGTSNGVITATNGVGSPATKSFSIVIASAPTSGLVVNFNFEPVGTATPGGNWNTVTGYSSGSLSNAKDFNTGATTGVSIAVTSTFTYASAYGSISTALYPSPIQSNSFAIASGTASGVVTVSGLNPTLTYNLTVFGSDTGGHGATFHSTYTVGSTTLNYVNTNNTTTAASFTGVTPNGSGQIVLSVNAGTDHIGSLGALIISSATTVPTISGTAPGGLVGTAYSFSYTATGTPAPTFSVTSGSLPAGLSLSAGGTISGTPTTAGTANGVISANNGVGSPATTSFSIVISSPLNVNFNFEATGTTTPGGNWNTVTGYASGSLSNAKDFSTGATTGVGISVTSTFTYAAAYGSISTALYASPIQSNSFAVGSGSGSGVVTISGLNTAKTYSITVFGSDTAGRGATFHSTYTIGSTTLNYVNTNNTTTTAVFSSVTPDGSGNIALSVNAGTDHIGSLGALVIHQN